MRHPSAAAEADRLQRVGEKKLQASSALLAALAALPTKAGHIDLLVGVGTLHGTDANQCARSSTAIVFLETT